MKDGGRQRISQKCAFPHSGVNGALAEKRLSLAMLIKRKVFPIFRFRSYWLSDLTDRITWQTLGFIGRSFVGRLTIFAPFVGYLIIFNPSFEEFFASTVPQSAEHHWGTVYSIHELRLYFLYFGLIFLGCGIILFNLFAPASVRHFPFESGYIEEMESVKSDSLVKSRLDSIILSFLTYNRGEQRSPFFSEQHLSFPGRPAFFLHDLIAEILFSMPKEDMPRPSTSEPLGTLFQSSPHVITSGDSFITTDEVMTRMFESGITAEQSYYRNFRHYAVPFSKQIFFVDYVAANYSSHIARCFTFLLYIVGFILLALPTLTTSLLILSDALN